MANGDRYSEIRQNYICRVGLHIQPNQYANSKTPISQEYESLYANGREIQRLLTVNGHPLAPDAKAMEDARVQREIEASLGQKKPSSGLATTLEGAVLATNVITDEQRIVKDGRSYITFNFHGDRQSHPRSTLELIAKSLEGSMVIDEKDRVAVEMNGITQDDVLYGGWLLVPRKFPALIYAARRINDELYVPSDVSIAVANRQVAGVTASVEWKRSLERRTYKVESCRKFRVTSRILPGFTETPESSGEVP